MTYALGPDVVRRRALATAAMTTAAAVAPIAMALVLFIELGAPIGWRPIVAIAAAVLGLGAVRLFVVRGQVARHLSALQITLEEDALVVRTRSGTHHIPRASIERLLGIPGPLGGLRVELAEGWDGRDDSPAFVDVPRGGEGFGELRAGLERWHPIAPPKRVGTRVRIALGVLVVLALFFVPFFLDDVFGRSKVGAVGAVLAFWIIARIVLSRR